MCDELSREAARIIVDAGALSFGEFTLSSGLKSKVYIDMRVIPGNPASFRELLTLAAAFIYSKNIASRIDSIVGIATGGIPWATGLALNLNLPLAYIRPRAKGHGKSRLIEGRVGGLRVLVVDDVATTGSSILEAVKALNVEGAKVEAVLVLLDRLQGARERLKGEVPLFYTLTTIIHVLEEARRAGIAPDEGLEEAFREVKEGVASGVER